MFSLDNSEHGNLDRASGSEHQAPVVPVDPCRIKLSAELTCYAWRQDSDF